MKNFKAVIIDSEKVKTGIGNSRKERRLTFMSGLIGEGCASRI